MSATISNPNPTQTPHGRLYLVPAPLDFGCDEQSNLQNSMPMGTLTVAAKLQYWVCENAKSARAYLKRIGEVFPLCVPLQSMDIAELPREVQQQIHTLGLRVYSIDAESVARAAGVGGRINTIMQVCFFALRILQADLAASAVMPSKRTRK